MLPLHPYLQSLAGGACIGLAAAMLLVLNGRIAGVSGIFGGMLRWPFSRNGLWRAAFILGLVLGPFGFAALTGALPRSEIAASMPVLIAGGALVGFGTQMGSGCTSGHGVCGLARLSKRSFAAVGMFMLTAVIVVFIMRRGFGA